MYLPAPTNHFSHCVHMGHEVSAQLRQHEKHQLADDVQTITEMLQDAGRNMEDSKPPIKEAIAKRESAETAIDVAVRDFRLKLSARGLDATSVPPYTHIFHDGVTYYISNSLKFVEPRCTELLARVETELPEDDALRVEITQAITTALERFETAVDEVNAARTTAAIARTHYLTTRKEWNTRMTRVYAALMADVGKHEANRFFPKTPKSRESALEESIVAVSAETAIQPAS